MQLWIISDTHFGHEKMVTTFTREDGSPARSFASIEEHDETMVARWNERVRPADHVWHLGDVCIHRRMLDIIRRLNGHKRLVRGNHDIFKTRQYIEAGFSEIRGVSVIDRMVFTHIPIHEKSLGRFLGNVHGHTHHEPSYGPRYLNVCVEQTDYAPVPIEWVKAQFPDRTVYAPAH